MIEHFHVLQISEFIALAYVLAWHHLRHDREIPAGICIGIACTLKLFPGLMVIYLMLARRWRAVFAAIAAYLPVAIIMTSGYGLSAWRLFFSQQGHVAETWIGHIRNASIHGIVLRLLTPTCVARAAPQTAGTLLATLASLLILALTWWITRRQIRNRQNIDLPFALFTVVSAFLNPWIWEHYRVLLILPLLLAIRIIADAAIDGWRQRAGATPQRATVLDWVTVGLGAAVVVTAMISLTDGIWDKEVAMREYRHSAGMAEDVRHALHVRLHCLEVMNWLPWVLAILLLTWLLIWRARRAAT